MKKTFLIAACALMTTGFAGAQSLATTNTEYTSEIEVAGPEKEAEVKRTPVEVDQLPGQVVDAYNTSEFADWNITEAYKVETPVDTDGLETEVTYELHIGSAEMESKTTVESEVELETEGEVMIEEKTETTVEEETSAKTVLIIDEEGLSVEEKTSEVNPNE
ncbi:MAG: hypothetical protein WBB45_22715 [Cyclobacteriaceae bacterium]